jgi:mono/diheme cytochrome c family protein
MKKISSHLIGAGAMVLASAAFAQSAPGTGAASAMPVVTPAVSAAPLTASLASASSPSSAPAAPGQAAAKAVTAESAGAMTANAGAVADANSDDIVQRGAYLARAGDCIACHTAKGGQPFAGGLPIATPIGTIYSTNITPSKQAGIGNYTEAQFDAALRAGKRADGAPLYPAMPYTSYAKLTDADVKALYAYFTQGVAAVDVVPAKTALPFPFNIRWSMAGWNLLFLDKKPFQADPSQSAEWNRGAYLSEGLAHCSTCHTPRNFLMAEETSRALSGGYVGTWFAPNLTSDPNSGLGQWSEAEIAQYLRTGAVPGKAQAAGPMAEAIDHSFQHLSDGDLHAIAVYIKSIPAVHDASDTQPPFSWGAAHPDSDSVRGLPWPDDANKLTGAQLYDANCASCHQAKGEGSPDGGLPSLFHNTVLGHANTDNLVMAILQGVQREADDNEHVVDMPGFAKTLSDEQIVTLGNHLLKQYGNPASTVTLEQVQTLRAGGKPSVLLPLARAGMAGALVVIVLLLLVWRFKRRRTRV